MTDMMRFDFENGVGSLRLDDGTRYNWMSLEYVDRLAAMVHEVKHRFDNGDIRSLMVWGDEVFSMGEPLELLREWCDVPGDELTTILADYSEKALCLLDIPVPTVAIVSGGAFRAGLGLALSCDVIVVDADASLGFRAATHHLYPSLASTTLTKLRLGRQKAAELLFDDRDLKGQACVLAGLAASSADSGHPWAQKYCASVAASSLDVIKTLKRELGVDRETVHDALPGHIAQQVAQFGEASTKKAIDAAIAKRR